MCIAASPDEADQIIRAVRPHNHWVKLTASQIIAHGLRLEWQPDDDIPHHAGILGWPEAKNARVALQRLLANECEWCGTPPPIPHEDVQP